MNEDNSNSKLASPSASSGEAAAVLATDPLHQAAVLVVDDSRTMRLALIRALNALGFREDPGILKRSRLTWKELARSTACAPPSSSPTPCSMPTPRD